MDEPPSQVTLQEIRPTRLGHQKLLVLSDGRELLVHPEALLAHAELREGAPVPEETLAELERDSWRALAHEAALRLLSHRARSEQEMRTRLAMRGIPSEVVEAEIQRLREAGLLDDTQFANAWVEERRRTSPRSRQLLRFELLGKGIAPETADLATRDVEDLPTAIELARKRARTTASGEDEATFLQRIVEFLRRRGFDFETARHAARLVWEELRSSASADAVDCNA